MRVAKLEPIERQARDPFLQRHVAATGEHAGQSRIADRGREPGKAARPLLRGRAAKLHRPSVREIDAIGHALGRRRSKRREDGGRANRRPEPGEQFRATGAEIEDRRRVGAAERMRRHALSLLWCAAVQGRQLVLQGRVHSDSSEGANHGETDTRQDRRRGRGARLRLRRRGRAHGARHRCRPGAGGGAGARARHQLLRHGADLRQRRVGEEPRPRPQDPPAERGRRHQGPHPGRGARPRRRGGDGVPRGEPRPSRPRARRPAPAPQPDLRGRARRHHERDRGARSGGARPRRPPAPGQDPLLRHHGARRHAGAPPRDRRARARHGAGLLQPAQSERRHAAAGGISGARLRRAPRADARGRGWAPSASASSPGAP